MQLRQAVSAFVIVLSTALAVQAGGVRAVQFGSPDTPAARSHQAALTFRTVGCQRVDNIVYSASAEGFVEGKRRSVPLAVIEVGQGMYGVKREWPNEGRWVIVVNAAVGEAHWGAVVDMPNLNNAAQYTRSVTADDASARLTPALPVTAAVEH